MRKAFSGLNPRSLDNGACAFRRKGAEVCQSHQVPQEIGEKAWGMDRFVKRWGPGTTYIRGAVLRRSDEVAAMSQTFRAGLKFGYRPSGPGSICGLFSSFQD